ncbi:MAG: hypothetical protein ABI836_09215 [Gemmatimonadota bacterium]
MPSTNDKDRLDQQFDRLQKRLPGPFRRLVGWLRKPKMIWVRIPVALLFFAAGFLGFLPILGFWMAPLGVLLLAEDIPFLRSPVRRLMVWLEGLWDRWKRRKKKGGKRR